MITTVTAMMSGAVVPSAAEQKHTIWHETRNRKTQKHSSEGNKHGSGREQNVTHSIFGLLADNTNDYSISCVYNMNTEQ